MNKRRDRIGILGGTFDPPHVGHLIIGEQACAQVRLDKLLFVPAYLPPHKRSGGRANPRRRLRMVRLATRGRSKFEVSPIEIQREGISYTIDTLQELRRKYHKSSFYLIVGGDNFDSFKSWKSVDEIARLATIVVYKRKSRGRKITGARMGKLVHLRGALLDISSTMIRDRIKRGESIRFLVPESVRRFIEKNKLYI
jgi:nicotinate-nucleotide adenylyltransferase